MSPGLNLSSYANASEHIVSLYPDKNIVSLLKYKSPGIVLHAYNPSHGEAKAGRVQV
jgi:hypothetical protein